MKDDKGHTFFKKPCERCLERERGDEEVEKNILSFWWVFREWDSTVYIENFGDERGWTEAALGEERKGINGNLLRESGRGERSDESGRRLLPNPSPLQLPLCWIINHTVILFLVICVVRFCCKIES